MPADNRSHIADTPQTHLRCAPSKLIQHTPVAKQSIHAHTHKSIPTKYGNYSTDKAQSQKKHYELEHRPTKLRDIGVFKQNGHENAAYNPSKSTITKQTEQKNASQILYDACTPCNQSLRIRAVLLLGATSYAAYSRKVEGKEKERKEGGGGRKKKRRKERKRRRQEGQKRGRKEEKKERGKQRQGGRRKGGEKEKKEGKEGKERKEKKESKECSKEGWKDGRMEWRKNRRKGKIDKERKRERKNERTAKAITHSQRLPGSSRKPSWW